MMFKLIEFILYFKEKSLKIKNQLRKQQISYIINLICVTRIKSSILTIVFTTLTGLLANPTSAGKTQLLAPTCSPRVAVSKLLIL